MQVDDKTPFKSIYKNKEYYFCSQNCEKKFSELDKSVIRVRQSLKDKERISFGKLKREIIDPGICTLCGACVASCEVLDHPGRKTRAPGKMHRLRRVLQPVPPHHNHRIKPDRECA
jgi:YHS domain.